jgi:hypothetical protein
MKSSKIIYSYAAKITDEPCVHNGKDYAQTARISYRDSTKNLMKKVKMPVVDLDELYTAINQGREINVEGCLVKNFSLHDYRLRYQLPENESISLVNFNAANSLFEADKVVEFKHAFFEGDKCDFSNAHFGSGGLSFYKASFLSLRTDFSFTSYSEGHNIFQFANFGNGLLTFEGASFINGNISFVNAQFNDGNVVFKNVNFGDGNVSFQFSEFGKGSVSFDKATFNGESVDFSKVNFGEGKLDFRRCDFGNAEVSFEEMEHHNEKILFRRAKFGNKPVYFRKIMASNSELVFDEAEFGTGRVSFFDSVSKSISVKSCILSSYVDFRVDTCDSIDLSNSIIQDILDFKKGVAQVNVKNIYLYGVRNLGKVFISWDVNNVKSLIGSQKKTTFNQKAEQYRLLKEDFHNTGQYEDEDKAYIEFKRNELLGGLHDSRKKGVFATIKGSLNFAFQKLVFDWMGLYATSPVRVLISIFMVYGFYSMLYVLFELTNHGQISCIVEDVDAWEKILDSFYFSAVTFLTIGYGECTPTGFFKIIAPVEGWSGVFMMSYFTVAFVRKILR